ncbi:MAG: histone deacetylase family protein [Alphaproteobacteria bacterium]|nr:histone deacetylase family protein [Alphaproteobacteria bacterium]
MDTLLVTHAACLGHEVPLGHPEEPGRLRAVLRALEAEDFQYLQRLEAPRASMEAIARVHQPVYAEWILERMAREGGGRRFLAIDPDTALSAGSREAMLRAAGAVTAAVDEIAQGRAQNAFCAVRPPGHHAERMTAMGFCFLNNVAIGAAHARAVHGAGRVAVVDFDVHHGNGTQSLFEDDPAFFYASTHQWPLYPGTGRPGERGAAGNVVNAVLAPGAGGAELRAAFESEVLPALDEFAPDFLFISAGFDGHAADPMAQLELGEEDFAWATRALMEVAGRRCGGRIVSALEGGYDLSALARSAAAHVRALMGA